MFNTGTFGHHPIQTLLPGGHQIQIDVPHFFAEAVKNGKHKIVYQGEVIDSLPILSVYWMVNAYKFSDYSTLFNQDMEWLKKHPGDEPHMPSYKKNTNSTNAKI